MTDHAATPPSIVLSFNPYELSFLIEALHDSIVRRLRSSTDRQMTIWRRYTPIDVNNRVLKALMAIYGRVYTEYSELTRDVYIPTRATWEAKYRIDEFMWETIMDVLIAEDWESVGFHNYGEKDCTICKQVGELE